MSRRLILGTLFASIALLLISGLHYYLARRFALDLALAPSLELAIVTLISALGLSILGLPLGEHVVPPPWSRLLTVPPSVWIGVAFLLASFTAISDLVLVFLPDTLHVRTLRALVVLGLAGGLSIFALWGGLKRPEVRRVTFRLPNWPAALNGFRIVQISDIHVGPIRTRRFVRWLTDRVNGLKPDLVAVTGDLVDGRVHLIGHEVAPFADLSAPHGVFFVTGNHDMYSGPDPWMARIRELGMTVLENESVRIGGEGGFVLAGVHDHNGRYLSNRLGEDVGRAVQDRREGDAVVLLAHDPTTFKVAMKHAVDLQISGHTHDGQIWPFRYLVRLVVPWVQGAYSVGRSQLWVSRGTGFWGPPMRLFAPSEISEITIRCAE